MKIFYKTISNSKEVLEKNSFSHEQLLFPDNVFAALRRALEESMELLPVSARKFQEWNVGLLERFDEADFTGAAARVGITPSIAAGEASDGEVNQKDSGQGSGGLSLEEIPNSKELLE
jgi:hypothetical protein